MTRFTRTFTALATSAAFLLTAGTALAGTRTKAANLPKEVSQMHCLVGAWSGKARVQMGEQSVDVKVTIDCRATSAGYAVSCTSRFVGMPTGPYEETDLFGYDPATRKYHWFSVTNAGETHDHVAELPTGPTVHWVYKGVQDGKPMVESIDFTFNEKADRMKLTSTMTVGKTTLFSMRGSLRKR